MTLEALDAFFLRGVLTPDSFFFALSTTMLPPYKDTAKAEWVNTAVDKANTTAAEDRVLKYITSL